SERNRSHRAGLRGSVTCENCARTILPAEKTIIESSRPPCETEGRVHATGSSLTRSGESGASVPSVREPRRERLRAGHPGSARWHGTFSDRLRDFSFLACDGQVRTGEQLDCNGQPAGYVESP